MPTPWLVGTLVSLFAGNSIFGIWLTGRIQRRSADADRKLTDTGQALGGFRDLVTDLQEERSALKAEVADLKAELRRIKRVKKGQP